MQTCKVDAAAFTNSTRARYAPVLSVGLGARGTASLLHLQRKLSAVRLYLAPFDIAWLGFMPSPCLTHITSVRLTCAAMLHKATLLLAQKLCDAYQL
jgi:hypothetical protein